MKMVMALSDFEVLWCQCRQWEASIYVCQTHANMVKCLTRNRCVIIYVLIHSTLVTIWTRAVSVINEGKTQSVRQPATTLTSTALVPCKVLFIHLFIYMRVSFRSD